VRNISQWSKELRAALRKSDELKEYVAMTFRDLPLKKQSKLIQQFAELITEVELGLTLLKELAPNDPATSVSALLLGYRFQVECLLDEENWLKAQRARFYLIRRKGRQWERSLTEYINLPETIRTFALNDPKDVPQLIPSTIYPRRQKLYLQTLSVAPPHKQQKVQLATAGTWYAKSSQKGNSPIEIPISIPQSVASIAPLPTATFKGNRQAKNSSHTVTLEKLKQTAREMDDLLANSKYKQNYYQRLCGIALKLMDESNNDFSSSTELKLEGLIHIVGLLNVGKSTLLEILIYHFAKQGYRCGLIVNDVVTAVRLASLFAHRLSIQAAPILGRNRQDHLQKVYEPLLSTLGEEITKGAVHPAWRWFNPICPLLGLVQSEEKWEFGSEPCHTLYQKAADLESEERDHEDDLDESDIEDLLEKDRYTCPLYYKCPRHQLEKDIALAQVWVLTPGSLIYSRVPRQAFEKKLTWAETVYRECDFLFVDEADRVQVQLDESFAPSQVLVDASGNSFLNKLGLSFARTIYVSDRRSMAAELFAAGKRTQDYAQIATDLILPRLHNQPELVEWLGTSPFTGRSLFSQIVRDLLNTSQTDKFSPKLKKKATRQQREQSLLEGIPSEEQRQRRREIVKEIQDFLDAPLDRRRGKELSALAHTILSAETDRIALDEVGEWLKGWLKHLNIPLKDKILFEEVKRNLHFAILITVLNNRLGFLVDNLNELARSQIIDFHDLSQVLVYRPPRDFLPVVPSAPVGNILGFRYTRDRGSSKGGKLEYFRYAGVGRSLLLNFPTLWSIDNWDGPHTALISGTSYAPGSPAYHINDKPTVLLEPARDNDKAGNAGISDSQFSFSPQQSEGQFIRLSGLPSGKRRKASEEMVKAICDQPGQALNFLDRLFDSLKDLETKNPAQWSDRQRILIVTNSYDEAEWIEELLSPRYLPGQTGSIACLRRDNAPAYLKGIRRAQIRDLKNLPTKIVIAPLMALERGHNILNENNIAAFGAVVFFSRPMPVPDDWQITVRQLNNWAILQSQNSDLNTSLTLTEVENQFYQAAIGKMLDLNCRAMSFAQLNSEERSVLCWTQLVSIWQIIGRLVRGGVPCLVHFLDDRFAPESADNGLDNETTSLLVGIIRELSGELNGDDKQPYEKTLGNSLYGAFFHALKSTKDLNHEL
jgi:pPIWI RE three-gene island domain Z